MHGHLARYVNLRVAHAPGMPGLFSPPSTSKETSSKRSRHASRHVRHARTAMHIRIAHPRWWGKRSRHSRCKRNSQLKILHIWQKAHAYEISVFHPVGPFEVDLGLPQPGFTKSSCWCEWRLHNDDGQFQAAQQTTHGFLRQMVNMVSVNRWETRCRKIMVMITLFLVAYDEDKSDYEYG